MTTEITNVPTENKVTVVVEKATKNFVAFANPLQVMWSNVIGSSAVLDSSKMCIVYVGDKYEAQPCTSTTNPKIKFVESPKKILELTKAATEKYAITSIEATISYSVAEAEIVNLFIEGKLYLFKPLSDLLCYSNTAAPTSCPANSLIKSASTAPNVLYNPVNNAVYALTQSVSNNVASVNYNILHKFEHLDGNIYTEFQDTKNSEISFADKAGEIAKLTFKDDKYEFSCSNPTGTVNTCSKFAISESNDMLNYENKLVAAFYKKTGYFSSREVKNENQVPIEGVYSFNDKVTITANLPQGFDTIFIVLIAAMVVIVLGLAGFGGYKAYSSKQR